MECPPRVRQLLYLDQELLALILHSYHHHVGLVDQVRGRSEHCGGLPLLNKINVTKSLLTVPIWDVIVEGMTLKYSLRVFENFLLYFTNSRFLCSRACFPCAPGM